MRRARVRRAGSRGLRGRRRRRAPRGGAGDGAGGGGARPRRAPGRPTPRRASIRSDFDPSPPGVGQSVRAVVEAVDPDGDGVRLGYVWSIDGESVPANGAKLDLSRQVRRGAQLEVRVTASDGHAESEPFVATTQIGNRPPRIANLTIQPAGKITAAGPITAIATGDDPDGDPISYEYTWTVNGSTGRRAWLRLSGHRAEAGRHRGGLGDRARRAGRERADHEPADRGDERRAGDPLAARRRRGGGRLRLQGGCRRIPTATTCATGWARCRRA